MTALTLNKKRKHESIVNSIYETAQSFDSTKAPRGLKIRKIQKLHCTLETSRGRWWSSEGFPFVYKMKKKIQARLSSEVVQVY